jgi:hypothetical protein
MGFRTTLKVAHGSGRDWELLQPLIWKGQWQFIIIRTGFQTDFASIPKPVRWLLDNAGRNAEAAVLHDAAWRESKRTNPKIDPWYADGMFRRALRETGSSTLTRGLMWFAVRATAMLGGRLGKKGPNVLTKLVQLLGLFVLGVVSALGPTIVAGIGLVIFWAFNWLVAVVWYLAYESRLFGRANWPWPKTNPPPPPPVDEHRPKLTPVKDYLVVVPFADEPWTSNPAIPTAAEKEVAGHIDQLLTAGKVPGEEQIELWVSQMTPNAGAA